MSRRFFEECIDELQLNGNKIYECTNGTMGTILQLYAEKESSKILDKVQGVPAVIYNQVINYSDFLNSLENFEVIAKKNLENNKIQ